MLPCISMARVRPSGETATDMEVPSLTVTSTGGLTFCAPRVAETRIVKTLSCLVFIFASFLDPSAHIPCIIVLPHSDHAFNCMRHESLQECCSSLHYLEPRNYLKYGVLNPGLRMSLFLFFEITLVLQRTRWGIWR